MASINGEAHGSNVMKEFQDKQKIMKKEINRMPELIKQAIQKKVSSTELQLQFTTKNNKAVVILGLNNSEINKEIYDNIDFDKNSATAALRALLLGVFSREILATHCKTGKYNNAFKHVTHK